MIAAFLLQFLIDPVFSCFAAAVVWPSCYSCLLSPPSNFPSPFPRPLLSGMSLPFFTPMPPTTQRRPIASFSPLGQGDGVFSLFFALLPYVDSEVPPSSVPQGDFSSLYVFDNKNTGSACDVAQLFFFTLGLFEELSRFPSFARMG